MQFLFANYNVFANCKSPAVVLRLTLTLTLMLMMIKEWRTMVVAIYSRADGCGLSVTVSQPSPFAVSISQRRVINSTRSSDCFARFANDARGTYAANNCWLVSDRQFGLHWAQPRYANGSGARVWLMTNRAVQQGEELLVGYGAAYWNIAASLALGVDEEDG